MPEQYVDSRSKGTKVANEAHLVLCSAVPLIGVPHLLDPDAAVLKGCLENVQKNPCTS